MLLFFFENMPESLGLLAFGLGLTSAAAVLRSRFARIETAKGQEKAGKEA